MLAFFREKHQKTRTSGRRQAQRIRSDSDKGNYRKTAKGVQNCKLQTLFTPLAPIKRKVPAPYRVLFLIIYNFTSIKSQKALLQPQKGFTSYYRKKAKANGELVPAKKLPIFLTSYTRKMTSRRREQAIPNQ